MTNTITETHKQAKLTRSKTTIADIKVENKEQGLYFFDRDTMVAFGSKIESPVYEKDSKKYFITSEQRPDSDDSRKYTIRRIDYYDKKGNSVKSGKQNIASKGAFQEHDSLQAAKNALAGTKGKAKEDIPKTGKAQFTNKQRRDLANAAHDSYENLGTDARELHLLGTNDYAIHRQREIPIIENLKKKMKKGVYERAQAEKLAKYMFDDVAKKLRVNWIRIVPEVRCKLANFGTPNDRREAAAHWVKQFESKYADGQYDPDSEE